MAGSHTPLINLKRNYNNNDNTTECCNATSYYTLGNPTSGFTVGDDGGTRTLQWDAPTGKQFKEWNSAADGQGTSYPAGTSCVTFNQNDGISIYVIWEQAHETKLLDVTQFETALTATAIAIRAKSGSSEDITFSMDDGFADAIAAIPTDLDDATGESFGTVIINFTVNDIAYQTENGMTWEEWLVSDYNIDNFYRMGSYIHGNNRYVAKGYDPVYITDIIENYQYLEQSLQPT